MSVEVTDADVIVHGASAGARVVLVAESISTQRGLLHRQAITEVLTATSDGMAQYRPAGGVSFRSVWIAVEIASGRYAAGAPETFPLEVNTLDDLRPSSASTELTMTTTAMLGLLVNPKREAAWRINGVDGDGRGRGGQRDGTVRVDFANATLLAGTHMPGGDSGVTPPAAIPEFVNGNVIAIIDFRTLAVTIGTVGKS
jgi:hypothetical protein